VLRTQAGRSSGEPAGFAASKAGKNGIATQFLSRCISKPLQPGRRDHKRAATLLKIESEHRNSGIAVNGTLAHGAFAKEFNYDGIEFR
jgi:hypothetical protein